MFFAVLGFIAGFLILAYFTVSFVYSTYFQAAISELDETSYVIIFIVGTILATGWYFLFAYAPFSISVTAA